MLQFSGDGVYKFIGAGKGKSGDKEFYSVSLSDEEGNVVRLYTDAVVYGKATGLSFGSDITPVIRLYQNRNGGIGANLSDFIAPSRG